MHENPFLLPLNIADLSLIAKAHELLKEDHDFKNREILALFGAGIGKLCGALFSLWPWTASGLVMSPETAFGSGIAQL